MEVTIGILTAIVIAISVTCWNQSRIISSLKFDLKHTNDDFDALRSERDQIDSRNKKTLENITKEKDRQINELRLEIGRLKQAIKHHSKPDHV